MRTSPTPPKRASRARGGLVLTALAGLASLAAACGDPPATAPDAALGAATARGLAGPGQPAALPARYVFPAGVAVFPEGIAYAERTGFVYVSATSDGTIYRASARDSALTPFLPGGADGRTTAIGLGVDPQGRLLYVAGGATGFVWVYDAVTGALLARLATGASPTFVNDVAVDRDGTAYLTDSQSPVIYRVVPDRTAGFRLERWLDLTGTAIQYRPGFNLNGIELTPDGRYLFVVQSNTGQLFRIDTRTRRVAEVDLGGERLTSGDGLLLQGATLYAVQNALGVIAEVRLRGFGPGAPEARLVARAGDPSFRFPTTLEFARGRLLVVNAQFNRRGPGLAPELPFTVSVVRPPGGAPAPAPGR